MEVLFVTHKYPPSVGGMEKQSYELINGVAKHHKVHTIIWDNKSSRIKFLLSIPFRVKKMLQQHPGISIIHLNDGLIAAFSLKLKKMTKIPIVVTIHGLDIVFPSKLFQRFFVRQFKKYDAIIAVSRATAAECLKRGFDKDKVFVVLNGVDKDMAHIYKKLNYKAELESKLGIPLNGKKILVSLGRSVRRKGFSWFLTKVLPYIDQNTIYLIIGPSHPHIKKINFLLNFLPNRIAHKISLIFGLGLDEINIKKALKNPLIKERAYYLGKLPFNEMVQILKHSDLFIMPNIKVSGDAEGFGLVALEAAISGLPVVASAIEGITCAVIDGENGFLVPTESEDKWIEKINMLLSDRESLKKFGESAKHFSLTNYAWDKMVDGYLSVFRRTIRKYEKPVPLFEPKMTDNYYDMMDRVIFDPYVKKNA